MSSQYCGMHAHTLRETMKPNYLALLCFAALLWATTSSIIGVDANVFMHNPRGSNNRGCETNDSRNNGNRLFQSANNGAGGYSCPNAWPFRCYTLESEADRDACNLQNGDQLFDDISASNIADDGGVLQSNGTRTPKMYFYEGSKLEIEWTQQHGCGKDQGSHCALVLQYACEDTLTDDCGDSSEGGTCGPRDGIPITNSNANRGVAAYTTLLGGNFIVERLARDLQTSSTIPLSTNFSVQSDPRFGRHETLRYYLRCMQRTRNEGLWVADQTYLGPTAQFTRQNPSGERFGFECPEEASYYPYWGPTPWKDIAIFTDRTEFCPWIIANSQNVQDKFECSCDTCVALGALVPIDSITCTAAGGTWSRIPSHNITAPYCGPASSTFKNQLGGTIDSVTSTSRYLWTIPSELADKKTCILRLRYNVTTGDTIPGTDLPLTVFATSDLNGGNSPVRDRQVKESASYISFAELPNSTNPYARIGLQLSTNQWGYVFQDRSWSFEVRKAPSSGECSNRTIFNLNTRGKRGNIIQTFPSLQNDFAPNELTINENDCIHVQWTGSDYNPARNLNDAIGGPPSPIDLNMGRADRNNLVQISSPDVNFPVVSLDTDFNMFSTSRSRKLNLTFIGQPIDDPSKCSIIEDIITLSANAQADYNNPAYMSKGQNFIDDANDRDRYWKNCGKLSGAETPYFDGGLFRPGPLGTYYFMSTRGNIVANRRMQGSLKVVSSSDPTSGPDPTSSPGTPSTSGTAQLSSLILTMFLAQGLLQLVQLG